MATVTTTQAGSLLLAATYGGSMPLPADTVNIDHACTLDGTLDVASVVVATNGSLTVTGTSQITGNFQPGNVANNTEVIGDLTVAGLSQNSATGNWGLLIQAGGSVTANSISSTTSNHGLARVYGTLNVLGSATTGRGRVCIVYDGGTFNVGGSLSGNNTYSGAWVTSVAGATVNIAELRIAINGQPAVNTIEIQGGDLTLGGIFQASSNSGQLTAVRVSGGTASIGDIISLSSNGSIAYGVVLSGTGVVHLNGERTASNSRGQLFNMTGGELHMNGPDHPTAIQTSTMSGGTLYVNSVWGNPGDNLVNVSGGIINVGERGIIRGKLNVTAAAEINHNATLAVRGSPFSRAYN